MRAPNYLSGLERVGNAVGRVAGECSGFTLRACTHVHNPRAPPQFELQNTAWSLAPVLDMVCLL